MALQLRVLAMPMCRELELAARPSAYSSRTLSDTNNVRLVAPPHQDQGGCETCTVCVRAEQQASN